jgi:5-methylcytosine-specific restriction endonuclease McrA
VTRTVKLWIGKTDDEKIPDRVKVRVFEKFGKRCAVCGVALGYGLPPQYDHIIALANGGRHAEDNLQPLCEPHHRAKTRSDMALKAKGYRIRKKAAGLHRAKNKIPGSKGTGWRKPLNGPAYRVDEERR